MDYSQYDYIIDARCQREFEEDHIPGALNFPVVDNEQYAEVGTLHRTDPMAAYMLGVGYSLRNMARHVDETISKWPRQSKILVYCFRGGKRSKLWFDTLETIGFKVEKLKGGWKGYRRWVNAELQTVPTNYTYRVLCGSTGSGKTRLLYALEQVGAQVLDLEGLARHRGSIIGNLPNVAQPSQKYFDTLLREKLMSFDPEKVVWVESESKKIGRVQLPDALITTMRQSPTVQIRADMAQRVALWREDYQHFVEDPHGMIEQLEFIKSLVGGKEFTEWKSLADSGEVNTLFERMMTNYYDPMYARSIARDFPAVETGPVIEVESLAQEALGKVALDLHNQFESAEA